MREPGDSHDEYSTAPPGACEALLASFLEPPEVLLEALAPEGWDHSPLRSVFHPSPGQVEGEGGGLDAEGADPGSAVTPPRSDPPKPRREVVELVGSALWDVLSSNHTVVDRDGRACDLGSFRGAAGRIADAINRRYPELDRTYKYIDFYLGTAAASGRADLRPVYRWLFDRLRRQGWDWHYSFPRLYLLDLDPPEREGPDYLEYDPGEAVRAELEERTAAGDPTSDAPSASPEEGRHSPREELDRLDEEAVEKARHEPLPATVAAYRDVYGRLPRGWPHPDM